MMVVLRAFALLAIGIGAGAVHHVLGPDISLGIGANAPLPESEQGSSPDGDAQQADPAPVDPQPDQDADTQADPAQVVTPPPAEAPLTYNDLSEEVDIRGARLIYEMMEAGNAAIIDARRADEYAAGHILGALNITPLQFQSGVPEEVEFMDPSAPVMIYCQGGSCTDSIGVGQKLRELGFQRLHVFEDGYPAWVEAGYEIEEGGP